MEYRPLNLEAVDYKKEGNVETFRVFVSDSPGGEMTNSEAVTVTLPADLRPRLRDLEKDQLTLSQTIQLGIDLADTLFPPRLRFLLSESRSSLKKEGLRIRLRFDGYDLSDIPWEYMYIPDRDTPVDQRRERGFLVLDRRISIIRDLLLEQPRIDLNPVPNQQLRMVVLLSNPGGTDELDLGREQKNIEEALKALPNIACDFHPNASIDIFRSAMRTEPEPHIFHFSGHGNFEMKAATREGMGYLALTDADGGEELYSATKLAMMLHERGVRLAVLGACKTSRVDRVNAWTGIAPALIGAGIAAVVGMQFAIDDDSAIAFSKCFYEGLAAGQSIDEAIAEGRQSIFDHSDSFAWGVPVLYMRARDDGILFPRSIKSAGTTLRTVEDELTGKLAGLKTEFHASLAQIDVVKDYKDLHDNLHDLQFAWFPLVRKKVAGLPDAKGAVYELRSHERDLRSVVGKLNDTLKKNKVNAGEKVWVDDLEVARQNLKAGVDSPEPQMDLINAAMAKASQVLETQPTFINGSLMRAVGALRLPRLIEIVQTVFDESILKKPTPEMVRKFEQGIQELKQINEDLTSLAKEHDTWQRNEGKINMIRSIASSLGAFEVLWTQLKSELSPLYQNSTEEWAGDLRTDEASLDQACRDKNIETVTQWFDLFSKDAKERFWNVDKLIKERCEALVQIRSMMEPV
jgi:hypothetical protein